MSLSEPLEDDESLTIAVAKLARPVRMLELDPGDLRAAERPDKGLSPPCWGGMRMKAASTLMVSSISWPLGDSQRNVAYHSRAEDQLRQHFKVASKMQAASRHLRQFCQFWNDLSDVQRSNSGLVVSLLARFLLGQLQGFRSGGLPPSLCQLRPGWQWGDARMQLALGWSKRAIRAVSPVQGSTATRSCRS